MPARVALTSFLYPHRSPLRLSCPALLTLSFPVPFTTPHHPPIRAAGPRLDYIDYDTRDKTYDKFVPKAYEVMEVLFNYKRTVEDFKRCNGKSGNPYNFPFVSDCVASSGVPPQCKDSARPVPCGDGTCRSDYVSCLRAMSEGERSDALKSDLLWAFKTYEDSKKLASRAVTDAVTDAADESGAGGDGAASTTVGTAHAQEYLSTLFGSNDRTAGVAADTGKKPTAEEAGASKGAHRSKNRRKVGGGAKLGPGHEFLTPGGSLEYTVDGVQRPA